MAREKLQMDSFVPSVSRGGSPVDGDPALQLPVQPGVGLRRFVFALLVGLSILGLTALLALTLSNNGIGWGEGLMILCFVATLPWTAIGFWNAVIGLLVMRFSKDPVAAVCPIAGGDASADLLGSTAILSCIRNEDVDRVAANLEAMIADLVRSGQASAFHVYVLSDTSDPLTAQREFFGLCRSGGTLAERYARNLSQADGQFRFQIRQYP